MIYEETYRWIQDRLRDLHSGTLSEHDLARLREIAKTDPFVADALEGYQAHSKEDHTTRLNTIAHRIQTKNIRRKPILLSTRGWIIQAAAACLIFLIATWAVMQFIQHDKGTVIAEAEPTTQIEETQEIITSAETGTVAKEDEIIEEGIPPESTGLRANAKQQAETKANQQVEAKAKAKAKPSATYNQRDEIVITDERKDVKEVYSKSSSEPAMSAAPAATSPANTEETVMSKKATSTNDADLADDRARNEGLYANQMDPAMMSKRVSGIILDYTGQPLIGAALNVNMTNLGTTSDDQGRFELFLPDPENEVDVTYSGYVDTSIKLRQGEEDVRIVLPERSDVQKEVAVQSQVNSGFNVPAGRAFKQTRPSNEVEDYSDYLRKNSRIPIQENAIAPGREVTIQFNVNAKGRPQDLLIVKSSNDPALDEEATRLIRRGPDWGCELDMFPCTTRYTIYFK